jgi:succinate dehydrogenase / fumarate reductase cytochrome b subunit
VKQRPKNLNLFNMRLPITAFVSILHRISGILLFFFIPFVLFILRNFLISEVNFIIIKSYFSMIIVKIFLITFLSVLIFHLFAGIRHILMDYGMYEDKNGGNNSAKNVLYLFGLFFLITGVFIW